MKRFLLGEKAQFEQLDRELSAGKNYKFDNLLLPDTCHPNTGCLWFGKVNGIYHVFITRGITTESADQGFRLFLERGEAKFMSMDDVAEFFHGLKYLYPDTSLTTGHNNPTPEKSVRSTLPPGCLTYMDPISPIPHLHSSNVARRPETADIVDKEKLRDIQENDEALKKVRPKTLSEPLENMVFGQDSVIEELANMVVINNMRKTKKLLAVAILGPTGTGKSETAKSLAQVMTDAYGTQYGYIEIAGSELEGEQSIHRFLGAPPGYVGHGQPTLLDPVRENPYHVIVINEIEKADEKILVGLMEAIDTGKLGMADNSRPIELNRCVMLFTSNLPIDMQKYESLNEFEKAEMCRDAFTKFCGRPEISGKIGNFLAFSPLTEDAKTDVIIKFVREVLESYDMKLAHIDEHLMADFLKRQTKYGARGIRVFVENAVGRHILNANDIEEYINKEVTLKGTTDNIEFDIA